MQYQDYVGIGSNETVVRILQAGQQFHYIIEINDINTQGQVLVKADILSVLNLCFSPKFLCLYFDIKYQNVTHNLRLDFQQIEDLTRFLNVFVKSLFEESNKKRVTAQDIPEIDRYISYLNCDADEEQPDDYRFGQAEQVKKAQKTDGGENFMMRIGRSTQNTMVMRKYADHNDLGLFTTDRDCQFRMALPNIADDQGRVMVTTDMLTYNNDHELLLLDKTQPNQVYTLNLDRSLVTNHIDCVDSSGAAQPVTKIVHKYEGDSGQADFMGFNSRNTMMIDPRVPRAVINRSDYKTDNKFTCGIATRQGHVAMGSANGIVRLYSGPCLGRATINFQISVSNEPIIAIDVSPDERWIVATCPYYISIIDALIKSSGNLGFEKRMTGEKPPLIRLTIAQIDQQRIANAHDGNLPPFTSAKFEVKNEKVVAVVGSIGSALVSWDFRAIEAGRKPGYSITYIQSEFIVDNQPFEQTSDVLYISPNQVSVAERSRRRL